MDVLKRRMFQAGGVVTQEMLDLKISKRKTESISNVLETSMATSLLKEKLIYKKFQHSMNKDGPRIQIPEQKKL